MAFSEKQVRSLSRSVPAQAIRTRMSGGKELTFIEGWYAVDRANRIFGFDGWDRETVETKCVQAREARGTFMAVYLAKVRISVRMSDGLVVREGHGTGEGQGGSAAEVHDRALKAAETDATKRALATFGKAFGLALYAGKAANRRPASSLGQSEGRLDRQAPPHPPAVETAAAPAAIPAAPPSRDARSEAEAREGEPPVGNVATARPRIDKSVLAFPETNRVRDKDHLRYVAAQPCLLCSATPSDAHHLRFAQPRAMGRKVGDDFTVPLCRKHHRDLHDSGNESAWWHAMGIEPLEIAQELWEESHHGQSAAE